MRRARVGCVGVAVVLLTSLLAAQGRSGGVATGTPASVYAEFGGRTSLNGEGSATRVGGAPMPPEVVKAMAAATLEPVSMMELHAAASRHIAAATGAEAGWVTAGASAGLTLGTAAILAGLDLGKMERLPDTTGM